MTVTEGEIKAALFSLHPNKSPKPHDIHEAGMVRRILSQYERASGQSINFTSFFTRNTTKAEIEVIRWILDDVEKVTQSKYLGLPLVVGRSKSQIFHSIREKMEKKLQGWKGKLLSQAGKDVLIKSVAMAFPAYTMSVFRLSKKPCKEICRTLANFWWESDVGAKRIHWMKWSDITEAIGRGGPGFRDLEHFNTALLAKQCWRFLIHPNLLVSKLMKVRYFDKISMFNATAHQNSSWMWKSLKTAMPLLEEGLRKKVGDGKLINIWEDK
ncbi:hypothetical protein ACH5RR_032256 [Cinchona calisaya]|uniref:Reverse transcriptase n=1 Tax=Cinchona calisaya TaxID=153742 RepID=A0ABD2YLP2_9GENT